MLIFVTGGVRSGKSAFAEKLAKEQAESGHLHYIATSERNDTEMMDRIAHHEYRRYHDDVPWITWEPSPFSVEPTINMEQLPTKIPKHSVILLDCLTTWVNNELFTVTEANEYRLLTRSEQKQLFHTMIRLLISLQHERTLLVVSNELFYDVPTYDDTTLAYMALLGSLHQKIVQMADEAYVCEHGTPIKMKGIQSVR